MKSNYKVYDHEDGAARIREILNQSDVSYEERDSLPPRDSLTFSNGFYANCSALFIDIRNSSGLPVKYKRPTLARLYRAYLSEMVAVLNSFVLCVEVNIVGDGVWAVYNTPLKPNIDAVFEVAYNANSMLGILNDELRRKGMEGINTGIGLSWGRALMVKAGFNGSGLNEVVYMGDVVNEAAHLAANGSKTYNDPTFMVSDDFYGNLDDHNKGLLKWSQSRQCWTGEVINRTIDAWWQTQK
ncbi:adenylate/guanylate cyclase domain-containing protein [Curtobacterium flaccumfaciens]|uniref:adenylate/guanylate cyclase domain-containing protein n=1 Tax=Curtobacterium flaccumfaciens TaxID=2035 RepID=UPI003879AD47